MQSHDDDPTPLRPEEVTPASSPSGSVSEQASYDLETAKATLDACTHDLDREEDRMRGIDSKLTQLAAFAGVSISISGSVGGSVLAAGRLSPGFLIALGSCLALGVSLLLAAVISAFRALSPKAYQGIDEEAVADRVTKEALARPPDQAIATFAGSRRDVLFKARSIIDGKADAAIRTFIWAGCGFVMIVLGLLVTAVGSVV